MRYTEKISIQYNPAAQIKNTGDLSYGDYLSTKEQRWEASTRLEGSHSH